jgi:hypothetical protein
MCVFLEFVRCQAQESLLDFERRLAMRNAGPV